VSPDPACIRSVPSCKSLFAHSFTLCPHSNDLFQADSTNSDLFSVIDVQKPQRSKESLNLGVYFKLYQSQMPVIERAIETACLMLGSDRSRGYCLEMICADFLAGANLDHGDPEMLLFSMTRFFKFLPGEQRQQFLSCLDQKAS
jgi:hypothetical protein